MPAGGSGSGTAFGTVPSSIPVPPNVFSQLSGVVPGFSGNTTGTGSVIGSQLAGNVSPQTMNALKTGAAQFGVSSGMPGSGLEQNQLFGNIAGFSEGQQQKGVQNYLSEAGVLGPQMTNPNLAAEISARNADLAAAPDPAKAAAAALQQWIQKFNLTRSSGGSYGSGPGSWDYGGTLGPSAGGTHTNWGGTGMNVPGYGSGDGATYPNLAPATATPPPGGWPGAPSPWGSDFAVGQPNPTVGNFYAGSGQGNLYKSGEYDTGIDPTNPYGVGG